eukprot:SAG31_NODE_18109_length_646_cov_1.367459_1_plen_42_part_01
MRGAERLVQPHEREASGKRSYLTALNYRVFLCPALDTGKLYN